MTGRGLSGDAFMRSLGLIITLLWTPAAIAQTWTDLTPPSWSHHAVRAIEVDEATGDVYVGLAGGPSGSAQVWKWECGCQDPSWSLVGGDQLGWNGFNSVSGLLMHDGDLYATLGYGGSRVYRLRDGTWSQIGGDLIANSWSPARHEWAYEIVEWQGSVYVGLRNNEAPHGGAVYRLMPDDTWAAIGKWDGVYGVYSMLATADHLYLGMDGKPDTPDAAQVWRWDGSEWAQIGGESINGSWEFAGASLVESLIEYDGSIVATLGYWPTEATHMVWAFDPVAETWAELGTQANAWSSWHIMNDSLVVDGTLYVGGGGVPAAGAYAGLWRYDGPGYTLVGGKGVNGSWPESYAGSSTQWTYRLHELGTGLLVGLAGGNDGAQLWQYKP